MHELGLLVQAARTVTATAAEHGIEEVKGIEFEIGEASGALPEIFEEYFPMIQEDYPVLKAAELSLRVIKCRALCSDCSAIYDLMKCEGICPRCASENKTVLSGQDITIKNIWY